MDMRERPGIADVSLVVAALLFASHARGQVTFTIIDSLPGAGSMEAWSISADGRTVVGSADSPGLYSRAFHWTAETGVQDLGFLPGGTFATAYSVSGDGSVVVGVSGSYSSQGYTAYRWTAETGMVSLGTIGNYGPPFQSEGWGVSADGAAVAGFSNSISGGRAFRWTKDEGMVDLGAQLEDTYSAAQATSGDGFVVVGSADLPNSNVMVAARWTKFGGMQLLGTLPGGETSNALGTNYDGTVIVGWSEFGSSSRAFRWTEATGMVALDMLPGGGVTGAYGVNVNGSVIVGSGLTTNYQQRAMVWVWSTTLGMFDLKTDLAPYGLDLSDWYEFVPRSVSADGTAITGWGHKLNQPTRAWILTGLPFDPATCKADCDASGSLDIDDFICFQTRFAVGDLAADCDSSGGLTLDDFICFQTLYALGC